MVIVSRPRRSSGGSVYVFQPHDAWRLAIELGCRQRRPVHEDGERAVLVSRAEDARQRERVLRTRALRTEPVAERPGIQRLPPGAPRDRPDLRIGRLQRVRAFTDGVTCDDVIDGSRPKRVHLAGDARDGGVPLRPALRRHEGPVDRVPLVVDAEERLERDVVRLREASGAEHQRTPAHHLHARQPVRVRCDEVRDVRLREPDVAGLLPCRPSSASSPRASGSKTAS